MPPSPVNTLFRAFKYAHNHNPKRITLRTLSSFLEMSPPQFELQLAQWAQLSWRDFQFFMQNQNSLYHFQPKNSILPNATVKIEKLNGSWEGKEILFNSLETELGACQIAVWENRVIFLGFLENSLKKLKTELKKRFPKARFKVSPQRIKTFSDQLFKPKASTQPIHLALTASPFQLKILHTLSLLPFGKLFSYEEVGQLAGVENAGQAVGNAVGANPISWFIPCHRVINKNGKLGHYHWGVTQKQVLLLWEWAHSDKKSALQHGLQGALDF